MRQDNIKQGRRYKSGIIFALDIAALGKFMSDEVCDEDILATFNNAF